jgi:hypothetical protein
LNNKNAENGVRLGAQRRKGDTSCAESQRRLVANSAHFFNRFLTQNNGA